MSPKYYYVPVKESTGAVNAIQAYVDYDKSRGGIILGLMGINRKAAGEDWEGSFASVSFTFGDPIHKPKYILLEPLGRLNNKKLAAWKLTLETSILRRGDLNQEIWNNVTTFAREMKFEILEPVAVEVSVQ